jgi:hypothetical protein
MSKVLKTNATIVLETNAAIVLQEKEALEFQTRTSMPIFPSSQPIADNKKRTPLQYAQDYKALYDDDYTQCNGAIRDE